MPSSHLILCHPLLPLPSIFPSIMVFSNESVFHIRWPKYYNFSFSISPSNEYSGLISFRMDWLDLLAVQGTLKSLLQHHSSKVSILPLEWYHLHIWGWLYFYWQSWFQLVSHQPTISHDVLCICVKQEGWQYTVLMHSFPSFKAVDGSMSSFVTSQPAYRFLRRQIIWSLYSHLFKNFLVCSDSHSQRL